MSSIPVAATLSGPALGMPEFVGRPIAAEADWSLWDKQAAIPQLLQDIRGAQHTVVSDLFGHDYGGVGKQLTDALADAARAGRDVTSFADITSAALGPLEYLRMRKVLGGAGVKLQDNLVGRLLQGQSGLPSQQHVSHRKGISIDGGRVYWLSTGNFDSVTSKWPDKLVRLTGPAAALAGSEMLDRLKEIGAPVSQIHQALVDSMRGQAALAPSSGFSFLTNTPNERHFALTDAYVREIDEAGRGDELWISSPAYTDRKLIDHLRAAAKRGAELHFLAPGKSPMIPMTNWLSYANLRSVALDGAADGMSNVTTHLVPGTIHEKLLVKRRTDGTSTAIFSSFNITNRSAEDDHELGLQTSNPKFVAAIEASMRGHMAEATQMSLDSPSLGVRIGAAVAKTGFSY